MKSLNLFICLAIVFVISSCSTEENVSIELTDIDIQKRHRAYEEPAITDACDLTISIGPCFDQMYKTAFNNAIDLYNDLSDVGINITIVQGDADIEFDCLSPEYQCFGGEGLLGGDASEFYDGDDETNTVYLQTNMPEIYECCGEDFNLCNITGLIVHEIGHVIGICHTNEPDGVYIEGTPMVDANSIFNGGSFCETGCTFTPGDILALRTLHPDCEDGTVQPCDSPEDFSIIYDGPTCLNEIEVFSIQSNNGQDLEVVNWFVSSWLEIISSDSQTITVKGVTPGPASVCATVKNDCDEEATDCFFFEVMPDVNCASTGDDGGFGLGPR